MELTTANRQIIDKVLEVIGYIKSKWLLVLVITSLFTLLFLFQEYRAKTYYNGSLSFILDDEDLGANAGGGNMAGNPLASLFSQSGASNKTLLLEIIRSAKISEKTLLTKKAVGGKMDLMANHYLEHGGFKKRWAKKGNKKMASFFFNDSFQLGFDKINDGLLRSIAVSLSAQLRANISDGGVIYISFSNTNEEFTKVLLDAVFENMNNYYTLNKTERAAEMVSFTKHRFDSINRVMGGAESGLASYRDRNFGMSSNRGNSGITRYIRKIGVLQLLYSEAFTSYELAKLQYAQKKPLIRMLDEVRLPLRKTKKSYIFKGVFGLIFGLIISILGVVGYYFGSFYLQEFKDAYNSPSV